jgi:hypothetical protein
MLSSTGTIRFYHRCWLMRSNFTVLGSGRLPLRAAWSPSTPSNVVTALQHAEVGQLESLPIDEYDSRKQGTSAKSIPGGGAVAKYFLSSAVAADSSDIPLVLLIHFATEGNNIPEATLLAEAVDRVFAVYAKDNGGNGAATASSSLESQVNALHLKHEVLDPNDMYALDMLAKKWHSPPSWELMYGNAYEQELFQ